MNDIQAALQTFLPAKRKLTPSGWISFNAPCCQNRGEGPDTRQRGGVLIPNTGGFQYHCFNCNFKAGWAPGHILSKNTKDLFRWLGMSSTDVDRLNLYTLKNKEETTKSNKKPLNYTLEEKSLPENTRPLTEWFDDLDITEDTAIKLETIVKYITETRGMQLDWYPWHYSDSPGYQDRIIIPFYHNNKIVGWTGRKVTNGKPKYLTDAQPGYVFNLDNQTSDRKYTIIVEGQLDAIAIDGSAIMHNEPNETQCSRINALGKEIIVVPDRDRPGAKLVQAALNNNWSVSLPPWQEHIKDVADAVKNYGRLYTLFTILHYRETNEIKIQLLKKKLLNLNE